MFKKLIMFLSFTFLVLFSVKIQASSIDYNDYINNQYNNYWDTYFNFTNGIGDVSPQVFWTNTVDELAVSSPNYTANSLNYHIEYLRSISTDATEYATNIDEYLIYVNQRGIRLNIPESAGNIVKFGVFDYAKAGSNANFPVFDENYFHNYLGSYSFDEVVITFQNLTYTGTFNYAINATSQYFLTADSATYYIGGIENPIETIVVDFDNLYRNNVIDLGFYYIPASYYVDALEDYTFTHDVWTYSPDEDYYYFNGYTNNNRQYNLDYFYDFVKAEIEPIATNDEEFQILLGAIANEIATNGIDTTLPDGNLWRFEVSIGGPWEIIDLFNYQSETLLNIKLQNITINNIVYGQTGGDFQAEYLLLSYNGLNRSIPYLNYPQAEISIRVKVASLYTVSFDVNDGSAVASQNKYTNQYLSTFTAPTRLGYEFLGWSNDSFYASVNVIGFDEPYSVVDIYTIPVTNNQTYYALWRRNVHQVDLTLNGGQFTYCTWQVCYLPVLNVEYNDTVLNNLQDWTFSGIVTKAGNTFDGWYLDANFTTPFNPSTPITNDLTIYAKWLPIISTEETPNLINTVMNNFGLYNNAGFMILYVFILIGLVILLSAIGAPDLINLILFMALTILWGYMGWLTPYAIILFVLVDIALFLGIMKWRS
ncbi:MAG: InlB B-repeat-containing protein [Desulfuromonadaceae bacterium]|nr:InlB B-repeat-containing protein [Desulfuromonadaceae bacterium]